MRRGLILHVVIAEYSVWIQADSRSNLPSSWKNNFSKIQVLFGGVLFGGVFFKRKNPLY